MRVYIAGPITIGKQVDHARASIDAAEAVFKAGHFPYSPLMPHLTWQLVYPHHYEEWMKLDFAWLSACDALIRLPGESKGADREVIFAMEHKIPVFLSVDDFVHAVKNGGVGNVGNE